MLAAIKNANLFLLLIVLIVLSIVNISHAENTTFNDRTPVVRDAIVNALSNVDSPNEVTNQHLASINVLYINQPTKSLKTGDFEGLSALTEVNLNLSQLETLPADIFTNLDQLIVLSLTGTQLSALPSGIFDNLSALKYLGLSRNQLSVLPDGIFDSLTELTVLDLRDNQLSVFPDGIFEHLSNLLIFYLGTNKFDSLPVEIFDDLTALTSLDLSYNRISELDPGSFDAHKKLNHLYLTGNRISSLPTGIFDRLTVLSSLHLSENRFSGLPAGIFKRLTSLRNLDLSLNKVDPLPLNISLVQIGTHQYKIVVPTGAPFNIVLPITLANGDLKKDESVTTIPIGEIESEPFEIYGTEQLQKTIVDIETMPDLPRGHQGYQLVKIPIIHQEGVEDIVQNDVVDIPDVNLRLAIATALCKSPELPISGAEMSRITSLFAEHSDIHDLTGLEAANNLTLLYLGNNAITDITPLTELSKLTELQLKDNNLSDISAIAKLTNLRQLHIGNNNVDNIETIAALTHLNLLYLNDNNITDISAITNLTNLTELNLNGNKITDIEVLSKLTELKGIYLRENSIISLKPLTANTGLVQNTEIDVRSNPLHYSAINTDIPLLRGKGVEIDFDTRSVKSLVKVLGDKQQGNLGTFLHQPFIVEALDYNNIAFAGVPVTFSIASGDGKLSITSTTTDVNGRVESTLLLGDTSGTTKVNVNISGSTVSASFTATAIKIDTVFTPVSNRTSKVREAILTAVRSEFPSVSSYVDITETHLASIKVLRLNNKKITGLKRGDFDGLTGLNRLWLNNNQITILPTGIFSDLSELTDLNLYNNKLNRLPAGTFENMKRLKALRLGRNAVNPLPIQMFLEKVADGQFRAVVPTGAMFDVVLSIKATNGSINGKATTLTIPKGSIVSETRVVTSSMPDIKNKSDVTVAIDALPSLPRNHYGYKLVNSNVKPLIVIPTTNTAPEFKEGIETVRSIAENVVADINIGNPITATDADKDVLTYNLSGTDADIFAIDQETGQLKTRDTLDYETKQKYHVTITASDGILTGTINVTINITNILELSTTVAVCNIGDVLAPGQSCRYPETNQEFSVNPNGFGQFLIYTAEEKLSLKNMDFEGESYTLAAEKLDNGSWRIIDVSDFRTNTAPKFNVSDGTTRFVLENTPSSTNIGNPITATDVDSDVLTYSLEGFDAQSFDIDSNGQLKTKAPLDYETKRFYTFTVKVDDGHLSDMISCIISVTDADDNVFDVSIVPVADRTPQVRDAIVDAVPGVKTADAVTPAHLSKITSLNLRARNISSLKTGDFSGLTALTNLNLFQNQLSSLPEGIFIGLQSLRAIRLGHNAVDPFLLTVSLQQVAEDQYRLVMPTGAPFTTVVPVYDNQNRKHTVIIPKGSMVSSTFTVSGTTGNSSHPVITIGTLPKLPIYHYGYILTKSTLGHRSAQVREAIVNAVPNVDSYHNLTDIHLATITELDLSDQFITSLKVGDFSGLLSLRTLHLDNNALTSLPENIFDDLVSLTELHLNNNSLSSLPVSLFSPMVSLTHLDLSQNALSALPNGLFDGLSSLKLLNLGRTYALLKLIEGLES